MRQIGPEISKSYQKKVESGFIRRYLSGQHILDIGYRGTHPDSVPTAENAIGIGLDYPGYDGVHLPFPDESQDTVFSSHCYEHIANYRVALREWYRVLKVGGYMVVLVPHRYLYERRSMVPSFFNSDHKRFYSPASLLLEFEEALPVNGYRVRHLADNDDGFDYTVPQGEHAKGCYEIELVVQKILRPAYSDLLELTPDQKAAVSRQNQLVIDVLIAAIKEPESIQTALTAIASVSYFPPYEILRSKIIDEACAGPKITEDNIKYALRRYILPHAPFSEKHYLDVSPGLRSAIGPGGFPSPRDHFVAHGYFEGRVFQIDPVLLPIEKIAANELPRDLRHTE